MRLRLMATYLGVPYQAGLGPDGTEATLFSPGPPPAELGFTAVAGHWRKQVSLTDLGALWQSRPVGDYRGEPCLVLDDLGDRLHIAYLGRDAARAAQLGYWEIDREVFEVVVARSEVIGLTEERVEFPLTAATFPPPGEQSASKPPASAAAFAAPTGTHPASGPAANPAPAGPSGDAGPTGYIEPTRFAEPAGYAGVNEYSGPGGNAGLEAYHAAGVNGGPTGNGQLAAYRGADHTPRMPDRMAAWHGSPEPWPKTAPEDRTGPGTEVRAEDQPDPVSAPASGPEPRSEGGPWSPPWPERQPGLAPETAPTPGRRTGRKDRISPESVFAELLALAAIPQAAYAVDEEVPGAMCLVEADGGFEVFSRTDDARLEVHFFEDEEAAYFYLFGVLAAEAVRSGRLGPNGSARANGHRDGSAPSDPSPTSAENVSKYLRGRNLPNSSSHPARVNLAGGADGPPLPKQPRRPPQAWLANFN